MRQSAEVVIVGGGAIGCSIAYHLAREKVDVLLLERGQVGREASWASAGILTHGDPSSRKPKQQLAAQSRGMFASLCDELRELTGVDPEYRASGGLRLFLSEDEIFHARKWHERSVGSGIRAEFLEPPDLQQLEPVISSSALAGLHFLDDGSVRNPRWVRALFLGAQKLGARVIEALPVIDFQCKGDRVQAAITPAGRIEGKHFVLAAGAWSNRLGEALGINLPVFPSRGQIVLLESVPRKIERVIHASGRYLVPRSDGKVIVGATVESVGYNKSTSAEGIQELLDWALEVAPGLKDMAFVKCWSGLRPATKRGGPFLGWVEGFDNAIVATAHNRNGILLSAVTGLLIAELISMGKTSIPIDAFALPDSSGIDPAV